VVGGYSSERFPQSFRPVGEDSSGHSSRRLDPSSHPDQNPCQFVQF
jgi:hypothetical protein